MSRQRRAKPDINATSATSMRDRLAYFEEHAIPLRSELEMVARRYTSDFHDAEDLVSETYTKAWANFATFEPGTNIRAWLNRIMINTWIDTHRRGERRPREVLTDAFTDAQLGAAERRYSSAPSAEERSLHDMPSEALESALQALSEAQQAVVFYADIRQLPHKAIADIMGLPLGTVMSSIHRARRRLRASYPARQEYEAERKRSA